MHDVCNVTSTSYKLIEQCHDVFEGLGCIGEEYHIKVDKTIQPVQHVPQRLPVAMTDCLKHKLDQLTKQGIITPAQEPTALISNIVTIVKQGKIQVCICRSMGPIQRPKYRMPTLEGILLTLAKAKLFTVLDAKDGFHQMKLHEARSRLTTFWTPFGIITTFVFHLAFLRLQKNFSAGCIQFCKVEVIADDILVYGSDNNDLEYQQDHDHDLQLLLQRTRKQNLKLNKAKLKL